MTFKPNIIPLTRLVLALAPWSMPKPIFRQNSTI
jgi:hypothetical protein